MYEVGRGRWSLAEASYPAINAVSTVGFSELREREDVLRLEEVEISDGSCK